MLWRFGSPYGVSARKWLSAWASAAWAWAHMPQLPWDVLSQVDKAVARSHRPICQKIFESLGHTHSTHRCCRGCLIQPREGVARPRYGQQPCCLPLPGARSHSALQDNRKLLARHR
eukprot:353864-Chlamydomonas_euryale.AAC.3